MKNFEKLEKHKGEIKMPNNKEEMGTAAVLQETWKEVLEVEGVEKITSAHKLRTTAQLLENTQAELLAEAGPANQTAGVANYNPVLINLIRRAAPNMIAYDFTGVQPMSGPTGQIFAIRSHAGAQVDPTSSDSNGVLQDQWRANGKASTELFMDDADTTLSGTGTHNPGYSAYNVGTGVATGVAEAAGSTGGTAFNEVSFTIDKSMVEAKSRMLKAEYSTELQQDLKAIHGLDAETELSNILTTEILAEINREIVENVRRSAKVGAGSKQYASGTGVLVTDSNGAVLGTAGVFDMETNTDGRWQAEKMKALLFKIGQEANAIAKGTRRGRGNFIICSSDVATALDLAGKLDYSPAADNNFNADDTGVTFLGMLQGRYKVYIDPYLSYDEVIVGFKGASEYDAGMFYCPYVPLQMVKAVGENTFQPKIAFKTRYGLTSNPFTTIAANGNEYFRKFRVTSL